jgi:two-component system phosphate regulon response regulator PhoB
VQKHILIVEDEPAIRDMVAFALRKAGMEAAHAGDARGAQSMIAERVPDLILLDWMLPGMSGLDLARRLRKEELTRDVPIIMLTARGEGNRPRRRARGRRRRLRGSSLFRRAN